MMTIKKRIAALLLAGLCAAAPAQAEWKLIDFTEEAAFYVDDFFEPGPTVQVWQLVDYKEPNQFGNLSAKILWEVDCVHSVVRPLMYSSHPFRMGIGEAMSADPSAGAWARPPEDSPQESVFILVCGREPVAGPKV